MKLDEALRWLDRAGPFPPQPGPPLLDQLTGLRALARGGALARTGPAVWYALVQELRRVADAAERDLVRHLRAEGLTWAQVAAAVDAQLSSRQAAHAKWRRLVDPRRRTTTGDMRRGGRRPDPPALSPGE